MKRWMMLLGLAGMAGSAVAQDVVFKDDFNGYGDIPPQSLFADACTLGEIPPALRYLKFRPKEDKPASVYFGGMEKLIPAAQVSDYEFHFKFQFPRDSKRAFDLELVTRGDGSKLKQQKYTFSISDEGMAFKNGVAASRMAAPLASFKDLQLAGFPPSGWTEVKMVSRGRTLEAFVAMAGRYIKFGVVETLGTPLLGFNFKASTPVDFDEIQLAALPVRGTDAFVAEGSISTANGFSVWDIPVPADAGSVNASVRIGWLKGGMAIRLVDQAGVEKMITGKVMPQRFTRMVAQSTYEQDDKTGQFTNQPVSKQVPETVLLPDASIKFSGLDAGLRDEVDYFVRPQISQMDPEVQLAYRRDWADIPGASERFLNYEFRLSDPGNVEVWIGGRYCGRICLANPLTKISFEMPPDAAIRDVAVAARKARSRFLPLDLKSGGGLSDVAGIPFNVLSGRDNVDLSNIRNVWGDDMGGERYWTRSPYNAANENCVVPVPNQQYCRAWILCAVEESPIKQPVLTARLTRYGGLIGPQIADTTIRLPLAGATMPEGVKNVGSITLHNKSVPLYLVEINLEAGKIQDLIFQSVQPGVLKDNNRSSAPRLDFELLGAKELGNHFYVSREALPSYTVASSVHVFGATLEKSPVEFRVLPAVLGNSYLPGERAEMEATLRAVETGDYKLEWTIRDIDGKATGDGQRDIRFAKSGDEVKFPIALHQAEHGWYSIDFSLSGATGRKLLHHTAFFSLFPADTRKAGYESRYFAWSHGGVHGDIPRPELLKDIYGRAGIGTITPVFSEKDYEPRQITSADVPWVNRRIINKFKQAAGNKADWKFPGFESEEYVAAFRAMVDGYLTNFPHVKSATLFHEAKGGRYPVELLGESLPPDAVADAAEKKNYDEALATAKLYRKYYPQLKLEVGNCGDSAGVMASLYRNKFPAEYIDFIGEELGGGLGKLPENGLSRHFWTLRELSRKFGSEKPVIACYEWKYRKVQHEGLRQNAIWSARDWLVAHAWRSPRIPFTSITDAGNYYYYSCWGDGLLTRYPEVYPYPAYAAAATMTEILDGAKLEHQLNTGSATVYGLEFDKRGGGYVYAFWAARGQLDATLLLDQDTEVIRTTLFGAEVKEN